MEDEINGRTAAAIDQCDKINFPWKKEENIVRPTQIYVLANNQKAKKNKLTAIEIRFLRRIEGNISNDKIRN